MCQKENDEQRDYEMTREHVVTREGTCGDKGTCDGASGALGAKVESKPIQLRIQEFIMGVGIHMNWLRHWAYNYSARFHLSSIPTTADIGTN